MFAHGVRSRRTVLVNSDRRYMRGDLCARNGR